MRRAQLSIRRDLGDIRETIEQSRKAIAESLRLLRSLQDTAAPANGPAPGRAERFQSSQPQSEPRSPRSP